MPENYFSLDDSEEGDLIPVSEYAYVFRENGKYYFKLGDRIAAFNTEGDLEKVVDQFLSDCFEFAERHGSMCSSIIEEACFPV